MENLFYGNESLVNVWNGLISDGEVTGNFSIGLLNSAGVIAKEGQFGKYYCGQRVNILFIYYYTKKIYMITMQGFV